MSKISDKKIKSLIENSKKLVGLRQVSKYLLDGTIKCVIVSIDSDDFVLNTIKSKLKGKEIPIYNKLKSQEIGQLCKIDVPCAVVGILS